MSVFNPRILEACIRDVVVRLSDHEKVSVLLYVLERLPPDGTRAVMENAVQSLLRVSGLPSADMTKALLIRAQARLAAGYRTSAQQDLHSVLTMDPDNQDVKAIIHTQHLRPEMLLREPDGPPRFSIEVWREIALLLPKRDLQSLLLVPHPLSRIASQLLFREIDLHLTPLHEPSAVEEPTHPPTHPHRSDGECFDQNLDNWHHQRSADILTRILVDPQFATQVRSLGVHAASQDASHSLAFQVGMLLNALPKLSNIRKVHCSGSKDLISRMLRCMHKHNPKIQRLSLELADQAVDGISIPRFKHLTHFTLISEGGSSNSTHMFLGQSRDTLRALAIKNPCWHFPTEVISVRFLSHLEFAGHLSSEVFTEIITEGHQLQSLMLSGSLECAPSSIFRQHAAALPFLTHFHLTITGVHRHVTDRDLCPAISEFLRPRTQLRTYHLFIPCGEHRRIGFDASAWGVLPALANLRSLSMTYPGDLSSSLAGWLVPRSVQALTLDLAALTMEATAFVKQIHTGVPRSLRYIGMMNIPVRSVLSLVEHGFSQVRVVAVEHNMWSVVRTTTTGEEGKGEGEGERAPTVEQWPYRRVRYHAEEWLESVGCGDAVWKGVDVL
ncbi:hypothetical protein ID866_9027 [Astraeus odoratus]|nr:hypothetical protein ID866_9027 [Astraeus odoratus]